MAVKIVTDSTANLPPALAKELGISVISLNVKFSTEVYSDGVGILHDEVYQRLVCGPIVGPFSSQCLHRLRVLQTIPLRVKPSWKAAVFSTPPAVKLATETSRVSADWPLPSTQPQWSYVASPGWTTP
jgi:hypothetical protein